MLSSLVKARTGIYTCSKVLTSGAVTITGYSGHWTPQITRAQQLLRWPTVTKSRPAFKIVNK